MDRRKAGDAVSALALILIFSFMLNYIWESVHEAFLYKGFKCQAELYIMMILEAAFTDASIIMGIYLGVAALWMDILWFLSMKRSQLFTSCMAGVIIAAVIEYRGVLVLREWSYLPEMPTIFGIGLTPLVQLSATGLLTFWLTRRILHQKCACKQLKRI